MVIWSDGNRIHLVPSQIKLLHDEYQRKIARFQMQESRIYSLFQVERLAICRSLVMEEYSDRLWSLDQHIVSFRYLILAAETALMDSSVYIDCDETPYNHPNLVEFRRLVSRCLERVSQEPRLKPILLASSAFGDYKYMFWVYRDN